MQKHQNSQFTFPGTKWKLKQIGSTLSSTEVPRSPQKQAIQLQPTTHQQADLKKQPLKPWLIKHLIQKKKSKVNPPPVPPSTIGIIPDNELIMPGQYCLKRFPDSEPKEVQILTPKYQIACSFDEVFVQPQAQDQIKEEVNNQIYSFIENGVSSSIVTLRNVGRSSFKRIGKNLQRPEEQTKILTEKVVRKFFQKEREENQSDDQSSKKLSISLVKIDENTVHDLINLTQPRNQHHLVQARNMKEKNSTSQVFFLRDQMLSNNICKQRDQNFDQQSALGLVISQNKGGTDMEHQISDNQSGIGPKRVVAPQDRPQLNLLSGVLKKGIRSLGQFAEVISKLSKKAKKKPKKQDFHGDIMGMEGIFFDRDLKAKRELFQQIHFQPYQPVIVVQIFIEEHKKETRSFTIVQLPFNKPNSKQILHLNHIITELQILRSSKFNPTGKPAPMDSKLKNISFRGSQLTQILAQELQQRMTIIVRLENIQEYETIRQMLHFVWKIQNEPYLNKGELYDLEMYKFLKPYNGKSKFDKKLRECFKEKYQMAKKTLIECKQNTRLPDGFSYEKTEFNYLTHLMKDGVTCFEEMTPFQLDEYKRKLESKRDASILKEREKHPLRERPFRIKSVEKKRAFPMNFTFQQEDQNNQTQPPVIQKPEPERPVFLEQRKKPIRLMESKRRQAQTAIKNRPGQEKATNVTIQNYFTSNKIEENKQKVRRPHSQAKPRPLMSPSSEETVSQLRASRHIKESKKKIDVDISDIKFPIKRLYPSPGPAKSMSRFQHIQNIYSKNLPLRNPKINTPKLHSRWKREESESQNVTFNSQRNQPSDTEISQQRAISASRGVAAQKVS